MWNINKENDDSMTCCLYRCVSKCRAHVLLIGQKYDYAVKWNINIVNVAWLQESVSAGYSLDEAQFPVTSDGTRDGIRIASATTSTPTNNIDGELRQSLFSS